MPQSDDQGQDLAALRRLVLEADDVEWVDPPGGAWDRLAAAIADEPAAIRPLRPVTPPARRNPARVLALAAAAVLIAVVGAVTFAVTRPDEPGDVIASVDLAPIGASGSGRADVVEQDGHRQLRIDTAGVVVADGDYLEVWLLDAGVTRFVSLGPLRADGRYDVPDDVDLDEFGVVDVSAEPLDGDPAHSGNSVLRGEII